MEKIINEMAAKVKDFLENVIEVRIPHTFCMLSDERFRQRRDHILEEIQEMDQAEAARNPYEVVDALVDVVYLALGTLLEMGIPPNDAFDEVHRANMEKKRGASARNGQHESIKPEGWNPPDHTSLLERMSILNQISPVFVELTKLRIHKGNNYNRGTVRREDHFPLGHYSYFSILAIKYKRIQSFVESLNDETYDCGETRRLLRRELNDLLVYACFYAEWMDKK